MYKLLLILCLGIVLSTDSYSQTLEISSEQAPTVKKAKKVKVHKISNHYGGGSMGLFDFSLSGGLINKTAQETFISLTPPATLTTTGNFAMLHIQEGVLSNYFLAKKYHRDKKVKFGFTETLDIGWKGGAATDEASNYASNLVRTNDDKSNYFVKYQAGFAFVAKVNSRFDFGATWYFYNNSIFSPDNRSYWKARFRYRQFMGEVSLLGKTAFDFKYLLRKRSYIGFTYSKSKENFNDGVIGRSEATTEWYQLSIGKVF